MISKKSIILAAILLAAAGVAIRFDYLFCNSAWCGIFPAKKISAVDSFEECAAAGFPVALSYPRQCTAGGKTFTEDVNSAGGIKGKVVLGPICPVERIPPDPRCAPKPYSAQVDIFLKNSLAGVYKSVKSGNDGTFSVALDSGDYVLKPESGGNFYPRCGEREIVVEAGKYSDITLTCDTGIR